MMKRYFYPIIQFFRRLFGRKRKEEDLPAFSQEENDYARNLANIIEQGTFKEFSLRRSSGQNRWKGNIASPVDAYILLLKLPGVKSSLIEREYVADDLIYTVRLSQNENLVLSTLDYRSRNYISIIYSSKIDSIIIKLYATII